MKNSIDSRFSNKFYILYHAQKEKFTAFLKLFAYQIAISPLLYCNILTQGLSTSFSSFLFFLIRISPFTRVRFKQFVFINVTSPFGFPVSQVSHQDPTLGSHFGISQKGLTLGYHTRTPLQGYTLGFHLRSPPQNSTLASYIRVPHQCPTLGSHLRVPRQGPT